MIRQLVDTSARGASLIITDRRWGATLSAAALGFGLFVGVAIGPGAAGTLATGPRQLIELPMLVDDDGEDHPGAEAGGLATKPSGHSAPLIAGGEASSLESFPAAPLAAAPVEPPPAAEEPAAGARKPAAGDEPAEAEPETTALKGTVVHVNQAAGSYALAIKGGELVPVHTAKSPRAGAKLSVEALQLANGTFAEEGSRKAEGQVSGASFRGVVTFTRPDPLAPAYTLSGCGASLLIEVSADPSGVLPPLPAVGSYATAEVAIEPDASLIQRKIEIEPGEPATYLDLSGIYAGLAPETGKLLLSADDTRASEADLLLTVPAGIDTTKLQPGHSYMATATIEPDGSFTLAGIAGDEQRKGADDPKSAQGDLRR